MKDKVKIEALVHRQWEMLKSQGNTMPIILPGDQLIALCEAYGIDHDGVGVFEIYEYNGVMLEKRTKQ